MNIFFTADTHFGHNNILKYSNRPFESVEEMDEEMIKRWNEVVSDKDHIYHLGDFSYYKFEESRNITKRLNGRKILIKGNHDRMENSQYFKLGFQGVYDYKWIKHEKQVYILSHYPLLTWHGSGRGSIQLHGHCHHHSNINALNEQTRRLDIGVDGFDFTPISIEEVNRIMEKRVYVSVDHH